MDTVEGIPWSIKAAIKSAFRAEAEHVSGRKLRHRARISRWERDSGFSRGSSLYYETDDADASRNNRWASASVRSMILRHFWNFLTSLRLDPIGEARLHARQFDDLANALRKKTVSHKCEPIQEASRSFNALRLPIIDSLMPVHKLQLDIRHPLLLVESFS